MLWRFFALSLILAALPASGTKQLESFSFGTGGTGGSASSTYKVNGVTGEQSSLQVSQSPHAANTGYNGTLNANVPIVTITNSSNYYNKLLVTIDTQSNPTDTLYAVAISTDNFTTTNYVKSDNTVTASLTYPTDYRTFASWGSGSGTFVIGLSSNTTYYVKAKAIQGNFSETAYGPVSSVATVGPQLSFSLSPSSLSIGTLLPGSVITAPSPISITISTNGEQGGSVYVADSNAGLKSTAIPSAIIASVSADISATSNGYGMQVTTATQSSGGPLNKVSPYNLSSGNVGIVSAVLRQILTSAAPVTSGSSTVAVKAKASNTDIAANDYGDTVTFVASGSF